MGFDRPDEDDAPTKARRDSPTAERDPVPVDGALDDSAEARAAYSIEYRALVDAEYAAAPDSWTEAVLALRRTWEEHEKKYPHPKRSRPTLERDGAWCGPGDLKLNPTQNVELARGSEHIREVVESAIIPGMRRIEAEDASYMRAPGLTVTQALTMVPDAVRFTFVYGHERYADGVVADTDRLKAEGFELIKLKKSWTDDQYKGINSQWRRPESGQRIEVQFHTPESYEAKQLTHRAYERLRGSQAAPAERQELEAYQRRVNALIATPPGIAGIDEVREKER